MIRPVFPSEVVNVFPVIVNVVSPVRPAASQLKVPVYVPERSTWVVWAVTGRSCGAVVGVCGAGSWAWSAQNPPIARKVPSITNKNIFLTIIFLPCPFLRPVRRTFDTHSQGVATTRREHRFCTTRSAKSQPYFASFEHETELLMLCLAIPLW
jgi:hypothetical protein